MSEKEIQNLINVISSGAIRKFLWVAGSTFVTVVIAAASFYFYTTNSIGQNVSDVKEHQSMIERLDSQKADKLEVMQYKKMCDDQTLALKENLNQRLDDFAKSQETTNKLLLELINAKRSGK